MIVVKWLMIDIIGFTMLAEGEPKPNRGRIEATCGVPVARFGVWAGLWDGIPPNLVKIAAALTVEMIADEGAIE